MDLYDGFVRIVKYTNSSDELYALSLYEGNMLNGRPYGFGRYI